jgi:hypothetical protein
VGPAINNYTEHVPVGINYQAALTGIKAARKPYLAFVWTPSPARQIPAVFPNYSTDLGHAWKEILQEMVETARELGGKELRRQSQPR